MCMSLIDEIIWSNICKWTQKKILIKVEKLRDNLYS